MGPGQGPSKVNWRLSFGVFHGETKKIKIWFSPEAAEYKKEKKWHESQEILE